MAEYINRKILVDLVLSKLKFMGDARIMNQNDEKVLSEIDGYEKAIAAVHELILDKDLIEDVQPVKHGRWKQVSTQADEYNNHLYECTVCRSIDRHNINVDVPYCWHCGAKMEE